MLNKSMSLHNFTENHVEFYMPGIVETSHFYLLTKKVISINLANYAQFYFLWNEPP